MSERGGPQRARGATPAVEPAAGLGGPAEKRAQSEREGRRWRAQRGTMVGWESAR
jgi:hypothetical protein